MNWYSLACEQENELIELRRKFHYDAELGNQEFNTSARIMNYLNDCGIENRRILGTAVVGILKGNHPGKTVMIRADIDALPIHEETGLPYSSRRENTMHACGHDFHIVMALGAAKILSQHTEELEGNVMFVFQPDEEGEGGAERLIQEGVLDHVDAVFGIHVNPALSTGTIGIKYGPFYAAAGKFDLSVAGKGSHAAEPERGIDALHAGAEMVMALERLNRVEDGIRTVVTVGTFQAGTVRNILCGQAELSGIVRTFGEENRAKIHQEIVNLIEETDQNCGTHTTISWADGYCGVINHDAETHLVEAAAKAQFKDRVTVLNEPTMTTEDFGYYLLKRPGCYYHLGVESKEPLHSAKFLPNEKAIAYGAAMHCAVAVNYLKQK